VLGAPLEAAIAWPATQSRDRKGALCRPKRIENLDDGEFAFIAANSVKQNGGPPIAELFVLECQISSFLNDWRRETASARSLTVAAPSGVS
jgi:hypothetical protein